MPRQAWDTKRERQYEHVKDSAKEKGRSERSAEAIAARTVNKNRARTGEADQASATATQDISPQRRGGLRAGNRLGPGGRTKNQLYDDARRQGIKGRSSMTKRQLEQALGAR